MAITITMKPIKLDLDATAGLATSLIMLLLRDDLAILKFTLMNIDKDIGVQMALLPMGEQKEINRLCADNKAVLKQELDLRIPARAK